MTEKQFEGFILGFLLGWLLLMLIAMAYCSGRRAEDRSPRKKQDHRGSAGKLAVHQVAVAQAHRSLDLIAVGMTPLFASGTDFGNILHSNHI